MLKKITLGLLVVLVVIQFFHPTKNISADTSKHISTLYPYPNNINKIMTNACNDCHTNNTTYPSYAKVQPLGWFLNNHIKGGLKKINFSVFAGVPLAEQYHQLAEVIEVVEEKRMPIASYTLFGAHKEAKLSEAQREEIITWAQSIRTQMKETYPADSLERKRKSKG